MQISAKEAEIDALINRRQAIADLASASLMPQFLHERDLAVSAWQGMEDNRILRAWEYTLSARAESRVSDRFMDPLSRSISALAANELTLGKPVVDGTPISQVEKELKSLINERFDYVYDASMRSTLAADGSSKEGGFVLVDNGRPGSGDQPTRIDGAETFQMMMAALSAQALQNVAAQRPQSADRGALQAAGQRLIRAWFASKPAAAGAQTLMDNVTTGVNLLRREKYNNKEAALPWALPDGYRSNPVLALRAGAASKVVSTRMSSPAKDTRHSPEDVASFLIDEVRKLPQPIADAIDADREYFSLPMGTQSHAFLLKPGLEGRGIKDSKGSLGIGKARAAAQDSRTWLRDAIKPMCDALGEQAIPDQDVSRWLERIGRAVSDAPELDRLALGDPNSQGFSDWKARMVSQAGTPVTWKGLRQAVADEFRTELTAGEFQFTMLNSLPPAARGTREAELKRGVEERLRAVMQPIDARMVLELNPPVVMLADLNWGSATEPGHLAVTYNPASGESEFWRCNDAQGTQLISPLYGDAWVSNVSLIADPAALGIADPVN
jgi:hypothetical protein